MPGGVKWNHLHFLLIKRIINPLNNNTINLIQNKIFYFRNTLLKLTVLLTAAEAFKPCINVSSTDADHRLDVDELVDEFITFRLASLLYDDGNCICGPPDDLSPPPNAAKTESSLTVPLVAGSCWWSPLTGDGEICCLTDVSCCWGPSSTKYDCDDDEDDEGNPDAFTDDWYSIELKLEFTLNLYSPIYKYITSYGLARSISIDVRYNIHLGDLPYEKKTHAKNF